MTLTSAKQDFIRTLGAVPSLLGKVCYLTGLRNEAGDYEHWGFAKTHGAAAASEAIHTAHMIIFAEVLRSPILELCSEVEMVSVERCKENKELQIQAIPNGVGKGPRLHFIAAIEAASALAAAQRQSTHPAA